MVLLAYAMGDFFKVEDDVEVLVDKVAKWRKGFEASLLIALFQEDSSSAGGSIAAFWHSGSVQEVPPSALASEGLSYVVASPCSSSRAPEVAAHARK